MVVWRLPGSRCTRSLRLGPQVASRPTIFLRLQALPRGDMECDPQPHQSPSGQIDGRQDHRKKGLIVLLVGAPGSGKSTFCNEVMAAERRLWVRVCQDTIANGKQGTKSQCLVTAAAAIKDGKSVFIDRCNLEQEQRVDFVKLGESQADMHAVVLDLPAQLCISRSVKRTGHEGKLQGGRAAVVVNRMLQKKELPKLSEGFSRITFCHNEIDVKEAVKIYSALSPSDTLSAGVFGQANKETKVQLGIMKFLKKIDKPNNGAYGKEVISDGAISHDIVSNSCDMEIDNSNANHGSSNENSSSQRYSIGDDHCNDAHTLVFPSISTADFQFDLEIASDIIVDSVSNFFKSYDNFRLVLVDLSEKSRILSLVREKSARKNIDPNKFFTFVGDISRLYTKGNLRCSVIANAANWRLKSGGGGVNAAIFRAAGESLEIATKKCAETLTPGSSVVVLLPSNSPLHLREGVTHVIHVLGPNMNPQRPNCLKNNYIEGCKVLRNAYSSLFHNFASIFKSPTGNDCKRHASEVSGSRNLSEKATGTCCQGNDMKIKREGLCDTEKNKKCKGFVFSSAAKDKISTRKDNLISSGVLDDMAEKNKEVVEVKRMTWGAWAQALHGIALNPEKNKDIMEKSDDFVVLSDIYPKAKKHILVVSRLQGLDCLADVRKEHLPVLKNMHSTGLKWAERFLHEDASLTFRLGYHSVPSMRQLHLHVISQDFDSTHLKNKKHWNSFNTAFFRDSADAIEEIEKEGVATIHSDERLLKMELRCHRCRSAHPNIPRLKSHIATCISPLPAHRINNGRLVSAMSVSASESLALTLEE